MVCHGRTEQHIQTFKNSDMKKSQAILRKRKKRDLKRRSSRESIAMINGRTLPTAYYGDPEYYPKKHPKKSYAAQNREAKKRKRRVARCPH
jgi:hypothetical protein